MSESPEEAVAWVEKQIVESRWIRPKEKHSCQLPAFGGQTGDLWRCDQCRRLWRVVGMSGRALLFRRAWLWQRIRYIGHTVS